MTPAQFIAAYNNALDQGQYPITEAPKPFPDSPNVQQVTLDGADHTTLLFVVNDDGSLRSVTALSDATTVSDELDRGMAQLEGLVVFSTVAAAATPGLTEDERNNILGSIGWETGTEDFADLALAAQWRGLQYHVINGDEGTNLIVSAAP